MQGMERLLLSNDVREGLKENHKAQRKRREREWQERLSATDSIIKDLECEQSAGSESSGLRKHYDISTNNVSIASKNNRGKS
jgi:hypothetical protein